MANELRADDWCRQMSSELAVGERLGAGMVQANELRTNGPRGSMENELNGKRAQSWRTPRQANELRAGGHQQTNELRAGEHPPHADCPTEAGTYRMVLTLHPADKNAMILGKKRQLT